MSGLSPIELTLRVSLSATAVSLVAGTALGFVLQWHRLPFRRFFMALSMMPLVLPPTVLGYYLLILMGRRSWIGQGWEALTGAPLVFTVTAAVIAASVAATPIVARQVAAAISAIDRDALEAAQIDGAGRLRILTDIYLPLLRPSLLAAGSIAFARAVGDFGATLMVAGNIPGRTQTASIAIYEMVNSGRDGEALGLVVIVSLLSLAVLVYATEPLTPPARR
ncbi:molybdate ABC transporter permease subunit [bacterium]|nr:molybdate ABC transporter permease subunit [bacterium]